MSAKSLSGVAGVSFRADIPLSRRWDVCSTDYYPSTSESSLRSSACTIETRPDFESRANSSLVVNAKGNTALYWLFVKKKLMRIFHVPRLNCHVRMCHQEICRGEKQTNVSVSEHFY
ncbi:unnamed protein product, partial [Iphiclides podalirius]